MDKFNYINKQIIKFGSIYKIVVNCTIINKETSSKLVLSIKMKQKKY